MLGFLTCAAGCTSVAENLLVIKHPVQPESDVGTTRINHYQKDFLYLKTLSEEIVPLADKYFPPDKRAAMEKDIFARLGDPECTMEVFEYCISRYLAGFNNQHALVDGLTVYINKNPFYPFSYPVSFHYTGSNLYVLNIANTYDTDIIGLRVTAINGLPVA